MLVGGVNRNQIGISPVETIKEILTLQQNLVLGKSEKLLSTGNSDEINRAMKAKSLIQKSQDTVLVSNDATVLYPSVYRILAETLVEARRLVGGL
jgi:hypothetical protein